jgi:predicted transcriptional regulator
MDKAEILIDSVVNDALEREAAFEHASPWAVAEKAISAYVEAGEAKRIAISRAIEEADAGVFISAEAIDRWVESWGTENELPFPEPDTFVTPR